MDIPNSSDVIFKTKSGQKLTYEQAVKMLVLHSTLVAMDILVNELKGVPSESPAFKKTRKAFEKQLNIELEGVDVTDVHNKLPANQEAPASIMFDNLLRVVLSPVEHQAYYRDLLEAIRDPNCLEGYQLIHIAKKLATKSR